MNSNPNGLTRTTGRGRAARVGRRILSVWTLAWLCWPSSSARADDATASAVEHFERRVRPVLVERCFECHSAKSAAPKGGLRLDSRAAMLKGGDSGPALVPGKPAESLLLHAVNYDSSDSGVSEMPPAGKLPDAVIADLRKWLEDGAPYPGGAESLDAKPRQVDMAAGRSFWSFQPAVAVAPPRLPADSTEDSSASARTQRLPTRIDAFVWNELPRHELRPAPPADRRTLLRRLSHDLRGLPPTYEDVADFEADDSVDAYERWVDRYLTSPALGERWARHWLDVARYAEDNPTSEQTCPAPRFPFRYRDWVIRAFNADLPYDEFVRRQLAADLLDVEPSEIAALGFLGLSPVYHKEPKLSADVIATIVADEWDERLDTITRGFLGLTVACARCHDHKFDPIRTEDYYALAGVLASTQLVEWPLELTCTETAVELTEVQRTIIDAQLRLDYAKRMRTTAMQKGEDVASYEVAVAKTDEELKALKATKLFAGPIANAARDAGLWLNGNDPSWTYLDYRAGEPRDLPIYIRGNANRHGPVVPRRFLEVLSRSDAKPFQRGSGRGELAEAIVRDAGSLTSRVMVNRLWGWHFGQPLVRTPSNFGRLGDPPSHPELLDDLAARFVQTDWSLKRVHREIVTSATWRQSSRAAPSDRQRDGDNRWLGRMNRRRLEAEAWRDAVLSVSGQLNARQFGPSGNLDDAKFLRRTVYGVVSRQKPADLFRLFDLPDAKQHAETRLPTTTPLQHLYLLNSPFVDQQAAVLAGRLEASEPSEQRVRQLFRTILLREPTDDEIRESFELIGGKESQSNAESWKLLAHALLATNEFLYVD